MGVITPVTRASRVRVTFAARCKGAEMLGRAFGVTPVTRVTRDLIGAVAQSTKTLAGIAATRISQDLGCKDMEPNRPVPRHSDRLGSLTLAVRHHNATRCQLGR